MPFSATHSKQTSGNGLGVIVGDMLHSRHHARPFRVRHLLFLLLTSIFVLALLLEVAVVVTRRSLDPRTLFSQSATQAALSSTKTFNSTAGYAFSYNSDQLAVTPFQSSSANPSAVTISPLPAAAGQGEAATSLEVRVETDAAAFAAYKNSYGKKAVMASILADYFAPRSTNLAVITEQAQTTESVGGILMTKAIYEVSPNFAGKPTTTIVWSGQINDVPVGMTARGLSEGSTSVPDIFRETARSMQFGKGAQVKGLATSKVSALEPGSAFAADLVSPAVVKLHHVLCGRLVFAGNDVSGITCSVKTGSGFLISSNGYIATNGHVVVSSPEEMLTESLTQNPAMLQKYLTGIGLNQKQAAEVMGRADLTAAALAKIYDLPAGTLTIADKSELFTAGIGRSSLQLGGDNVRSSATNFTDTNDIKRAELIGYNYQTKDKLSITSGSAGFSASDVALLKINAQNTPYVQLSKVKAVQNQAINVLGFPSDADNALTDTATTDVTVTKGTISAVRSAAGGKGTLYQTDADASRGNSGGPAIDSMGNAIGILTYRYESGNAGDAAKSYIRDITDLQDLIISKSVILMTSGAVQQQWQKGLDLYAQRYYSRALIAFQSVQQQYPSHRLVGQYIDLSRQQIAAGNDTNDPSYVLFAVLIGLGIGGIGASLITIIRHYGHYRLYKLRLAGGNLQIIRG